MSLDDCDVVAPAKSPFSTSATDTPRRPRPRAPPAPAMPPPTTTTSYAASSSGAGRLFIGSGGLATTRDGGHGGHSQQGDHRALTYEGAFTLDHLRPLRYGLLMARSPGRRPRDPRHHRTARRRGPSTSCWRNRAR